MVTKLVGKQKFDSFLTAARTKATEFSDLQAERQRQAAAANPDGQYEQVNQQQQGPGAAGVFAGIGGTLSGIFNDAKQVAVGSTRNDQEGGTSSGYGGQTQHQQGQGLGGAFAGFSTWLNKNQQQPEDTLTGGGRVGSYAYSSGSQRQPSHRSVSAGMGSRSSSSESVKKQGIFNQGFRPSNDSSGIGGRDGHGGKDSIVSKGVSKRWMPTDDFGKRHPCGSYRPCVLKRQ